MGYTALSGGCRSLETGTSAFFSRQDPAMVEWFVQTGEERRHSQDASKEQKNW